MAKLQEAPHVTIVNQHSQGLFDWLISNRRMMEKAFDLSLEEIDMDVAFETFDPLAYNAAFAAIEGDVELLSYSGVSDSVLKTVMVDWPERYFLEYCVKKGLSYKFELPGSDVYAIKEAHKEEVKTMLKASATKSGS